MNLLKSPVSVICRFLSMKSKRQTNMSAFVYWTNNRTECICSSSVGYHMRLWDTLLNVISTHKAFHFILLLQNDTKTEKTWSYAPLSPRVGKLTQGKYLHRIAQIISTTHWRLFPVFEWPGRAKGNNTISDVNVSGKSFSIVRHRRVVKLSSFQLDTFRQTNNTNGCWEHLFMFTIQMFYIQTIIECFSLSIMSLDYNSLNPTRIH